MMHPSLRSFLMSMVGSLSALQPASMFFFLTIPSITCQDFRYLDVKEPYVLYALWREGESMEVFVVYIGYKAGVKACKLVLGGLFLISKSNSRKMIVSFD